MKWWKEDGGGQTIEPEEPRGDPTRIYQCGCGSVTFRLCVDGAVICAECECLAAKARCAFHGLSHPTI